MVTAVNPIEHFKEQVASAIKSQKVKTNEMAEFYLTNLLASFVTSTRLTNEPLAFVYLKALNSTRAVQIQQMRQLGDISLFTSGFFSDSLNRKIVDIDYYMAMGAASYSFVASMHKSDNEHASGLFSELARKYQGSPDPTDEAVGRHLAFHLRILFRQPQQEDSRYRLLHGNGRGLVQLCRVDAQV